tara:strand:+ start:544 stop:801 length:258 start_codon:yes stop_codon:yes gene_type:complete
VSWGKSPTDEVRNSKKGNMKAKDIDIYKIFSKTFKGRKMFGFMGFGELSLMDKVDKPIRQTEEVVQEDIIELPQDLINKLNKGEK